MKKINQLLVAAALMFSSIISAQAPNLLSYQAVIRNSSNNIVINQSVGMRISILQSSATGTPVYVETQTATSNANGLVSLQIGGGTVVTGTFANINWAGNTYFVKTETDPAGGTNYSITGTQQLLSVPYALSAKNGVPTGGTTNQVLAKVNGTDFNTQWVTPSASTASATALPNAFYGHITVSTGVGYTTPFGITTGNVPAPTTAFFIPNNSTFTISFYSYEDEPLTYELWNVTPVSTSTTYSTTGAPLATANTVGYSSGSPINASFSYSATAGQFLTIKVFKTGGTGVTNTGGFYTAFSAN